MQLELTLEPRAGALELPGFLEGPVTTGRRIIGRLPEAEVASAIQWARRLKEEGAVEEYSVGPTTLEDVYLAAVGHDEPEAAGAGVLSGEEGGAL